MLQVINIIGSETAIFLVGVNLAIIYSYWPEQWLTAKLLAVSALLLFAALALFTGIHDLWLTYLGCFAVGLDAIAAKGVYKTLKAAAHKDEVLVAYRKR